MRLGVVDGERLTWIAKSQGARSGLRYDPDMGRDAPLFYTASGHAWLACMSDAEALSLVERQGAEVPMGVGPNAPRSNIELLERLRDGKVYLPNQAERAIRNFFRKGNLLALRELALRRTADRVDDEMRAYRRASTTTPEAVWPNREALLACVGTGDNAEKVVRSCARLAAQLDLPWHAVHVETPEQQGQSATLHPQVERTLKIAQQLGAAACAVLPAAQPAQALVRYAREHNLVRVVMGRSTRRWPWQATLAEQIGQSASDLDLLQVGALPGRDAATDRKAPRTSTAAPRAAFWPGYIAAALWSRPGHHGGVFIESASTNLNPPMLVEVPCKSPTGLAQKVLFQVQRCRLNNGGRAQSGAPAPGLPH